MAQPRNEAVTAIDAVFVNLALIARRLRKPDVILTNEGARYLALVAEHQDLRFESNGLDNFERGLAIEEALNILKTRFEKEFPHDGSN